MNQAMLAKVGWEMSRGDEGLWSKVLHQTYVKIVHLFRHYSAAQLIWNSIICFDYISKAMQLDWLGGFWHP